VLNIFVYFFGTGVSGELFVFFKSVSFLVAVTNSYLLNKWWVFEHDTAISVREPLLFLIVSCAGLVINVSVSFAVFTLFAREVSAHIAANIGALVGAAVVFAWNFAGYRFFVFKRSHD
jgi:putative flippase GtrA